jgi:hypothetical protein
MELCNVTRASGHLVDQEIVVLRFLPELNVIVRYKFPFLKHGNEIQQRSGVDEEGPSDPCGRDMLIESNLKIADRGRDEHEKEGINTSFQDLPGSNERTTCTKGFFV